MKIAPMWNAYLREVIPAAAPDVQRTECRRAFYAGAQAMYSLMVADLPEDGDDAEAHLRELHEELAAFLREAQILADLTCCAEHPDEASVWCHRRIGHDGKHRNHEREW